MKNVLSNLNFKPVPQSVDRFRGFEHENFKCRCGEEGLLAKYPGHIRIKHSGDLPQGSSHIIVRVVFMKANHQIISVPLPVNSKGINPDHECVCPCDPLKKLKYVDFINHTIKRQGGKSPKFWMRFKG